MVFHITPLMFALLCHLAFRRAEGIAQCHRSAFMRVIAWAFMRDHHLAPR